MRPYYKLYETKEEWERQARRFLITGFGLGFIGGALIVVEIWLLRSR